jgi:hypothetical protein
MDSTRKAGWVMRIESSVSSVSWIPSTAVAGTARLPFDISAMHYDDPPPDAWQDLDSVVGPEGARFANELRAWIEVEDGNITGYGRQSVSARTVVVRRPCSKDARSPTTAPSSPTWPPTFRLGTCRNWPPGTTGKSSGDSLAQAADRPTPPAPAGGVRARTTVRSVSRVFDFPNGHPCYGPSPVIGSRGEAPWAPRLRSSSASARQARSNVARCRLSLAPCARVSGSSTPVTRISASGAIAA